MSLLRQLRVKLTVLYAGLFCAALLLIGGIAYASIASNAQRLIREQLAATGIVFDRVWELRFEDMRNGARLASLDYGFREAVASADQATIASALENLRTRLSADLVYLISPSGLVIAADGAASTVPTNLQSALEREDAPFGVLRAQDRLHQVVTTPVYAPNLLGWIVVGERLDDAEMQALQRLSAIPLAAEVASADASGAWNLPRSDTGLATLVEGAAEQGAIGSIRDNRGDATALAKPLHAIDHERVVLILRYPMAEAMRPYSPLFNSLFVVGLVGLALLVSGSWLLANGITKPLSSLSAAARQLQQGIYTPVSLKSGDEVSELADSFNAMMQALQDRERKITHLAFHDRETRLPNRLALERRLNAACPSSTYVAVIGLERFEQIRTTIGYSHAEALVKAVGARLAHLASNKLMARVSSDMLAVAYPASNDAEALARARSIADTLEQPLSLDGQVIDIGVCIGVAQPRGKLSPTDSIRRGSIALDQARGAHVKLKFFDEAAYGNPAHNLSLMGEMLGALANGSMTLAHQPKLDLRERRIHSTEALVRWRHPTRGVIAPDQFIPMAEETGQIRALTDWVLKRAIQEQQWLAARGSPLAMSINISGRLVGDASFAASALEVLASACGPIGFEITETAVIANPELALRHIELFAKHGVSISIDDYGSGLSSLAYLRQLPARELKIDKVFIENLARGQKDALLVRSTIDLAHGLGLTVTAEGVEQPAALSLLASMGCDMAQGYLIARPLPVTELLTFLEENPWRQSAASTPLVEPTRRRPGGNL
jgi:EAL domain-containing protein (putative c-di-GMP-specific phosphodiesterase class I)/GGDEF domain-containing protein